MAAPTISRTRLNSLVNDAGSNLDGSPWTKAEIAATIMDPIDALTLNVIPGGQSIVVNGTNNALAIGTTSRDIIVRLAPNGTTIVNGILATDMTAGTRVTIWCNANFHVTFNHSNGSAAAANRLYMPDTQARTIHERQCIVFEYDASSLVWLFVSSSAIGPRVRAYRNMTAQSIATGAETLCVLNGEVYDYFAEFDTATGLWTARETGWYRLTGVPYLDTVNTRVISVIYVNGSAAQYTIGYTVNDLAAFPVIYEGSITAGQTAGLYVRHDSTAAHDLVVGATKSTLAISRIG